MNTVYIGLGTNIGDRALNLTRAKDLILKAGIEIDAESPVDETDPVDYLDQPKFFNQIIRVKTGMAARELLTVLNRIEHLMGRDRAIPKGPRIIDLDLLLYNNEILDSGDLSVPHYAICDRIFVMRNLVDLDRDLRDPVSGRRYAEVLRERLINQNY